jgi:hypothetical protein
MRLTRLSFLVLAVSSGAAFGQLAPVAPEVDVQIGAARATVVVTAGELGLDLVLSFEEVIGLTTADLGLSAKVVDALDPALLGRLPTGVTVPAVFPLMVSIEPPATGGLSFGGVATLEVHTHDLDFTVDTPLRLFASHDGAPFEDITYFMGMGSYRAGGRTGGFSDFLILADARPVSAVVDEKIARLRSFLEAWSADIEPTLASDLQGRLTAAESAWLAADPAAAIVEIEAFSAAIVQAGSGALPSVWRSARDLVNVAGELRAAAATLRFSLTLAN